MKTRLLVKGEEEEVEVEEMEFGGGEHGRLKAHFGGDQVSTVPGSTQLDFPFKLFFFFFYL